MPIYGATDTIPRKGGVRVQHATARNTRFSVVEPIPYEKPYFCKKCWQTHLFKTHHLDLDETGSAILAHAVYERLKGVLETNGFRVANTVRKPPTITVGAGVRVNGVVVRPPVVTIGHGQETT